MFEKLKYATEILVGQAVLPAINENINIFFLMF